MFWCHFTMDNAKGVDVAESVAELGGVAADAGWRLRPAQCERRRESPPGRHACDRQDIRNLVAEAVADRVHLEDVLVRVVDEACEAVHFIEEHLLLVVGPRA